MERYLKAKAKINKKEINLNFKLNINDLKIAALAHMVACLPLVQQVRGSIPGGVVNFHLKIFNLGAILFLIARLYIIVLD